MFKPRVKRKTITCRVVKDPNSSDIYDLDLAVKNMPADQLQDKPGSLPFPTAAKLLNLDGRVLVQVELDAAGVVLNAKVKSAQPKNVFDSAALEAVRLRPFGAQQIPAGQRTVWRDVPMVFRIEVSVDQKTTQGAFVVFIRRRMQLEALTPI
jgi:TonB family protein